MASPFVALLSALSLSLTLPAACSRSAALLNPADPCEGRRIFTLPLPARFNRELLYNSTADADLHKDWWTYDMVKHLKAAALNQGLGPALARPILGVEDLRGSWYQTDQNTLENIFFARMVTYRCRVDSFYEADMVYVPYFGGHDSLRNMHRDQDARDELALQLVEHLKQQPSWRRRQGADHFMVLGRNIWDFHRHDGGHWGSKLISLPGVWDNMWTVMVETFPGVPKVVSAPKPTAFHPQSKEQLMEWQAFVRGHERKWLFSFVGGHRGLDTEEGVLREKLFWQCRNSQHCSLVDCSVADGKWERCSDINQFFSYYATSTFCLHPMGDACSRRSVLDAALAGCIPVVFKKCTLEDQFQWHLGRNKGRLFVYIPMEDVKGPKGLNTSRIPWLSGGNTAIEDVLKKIPKKEIVAMRNRVVSLIPKITYGGKVAESAMTAPNFKDSVEVIIDGLASNINTT